MLQMRTETQRALKIYNLTHNCNMKFCSYYKIIMRLLQRINYIRSIIINYTTFVIPYFLPRQR